MGIRGRCSVIREELDRQAENPHSDTPWIKIALETAGEPVPAPPPPPDPPRIETVSMPRREDPELPSLWRMAKGLIRDVTIHVINGFPKRPVEEYERIMAICKACDHLRSDGRCGKQTGCGCGMQTKASMNLTSCPVGKW
jgi:hypothetical protein